MGWVILGSLFLIGVGLLLLVRSARREQAIQQRIGRLDQTAAATKGGAVSFQELAPLPAPVARYLRMALKEGQPLIRAVGYRQTGELRTEKSNRWLPFDASQFVTAIPPGFIWDARVGIAPFLHLRIADGYFGGEGFGQVSLLSAVTLADEQGGAELNSGALHRYLAEAVWYPTALLPIAGVRWSPIDNNRARATLTDSGITVSLEFHFNDAGEVIGVYTPGRYARFDHGYRLTPWEGHFRRYEERAGMRIPMEGEVGWYSTNDWRPVWKGRIVEVNYMFTS